MAETRKDIVETAIAAGSFSTLTKAVTQAELTGTLKGTGPYTLFAPADSAFAKLSQTQLDALWQDPAKLKKLLLHHVVPGSIKGGDALRMKDGTRIKTVAGTELTLQTAGGRLKLGPAQVTRTDIDCTNGVIHVIDTVLMP